MLTASRLRDLRLSAITAGKALRLATIDVGDGMVQFNVTGARPLPSSAALLSR